MNNWLSFTLFGLRDELFPPRKSNFHSYEVAYIKVINIAIAEINIQKVFIHT